MKKLDERNITRNFLYKINEFNTFLDNVCKKCNSIPCVCNERVDLEIDPTNTVNGESFNELDPNQDGCVTQEDLFGHFDLDNNGIVATDEYEDHINYHCDNDASPAECFRDDYSEIPCRNSYDMCTQHYTKNHDHLIDDIRQLLDKVGATCPISLICAIKDMIETTNNDTFI